MRAVLLKKILCSVVAFTFFINDLSFALSPQPGSNINATRDSALAMAQGKLAGIIGPGAIGWDETHAEFSGETPKIDGVRVFSDDGSPRYGWDKNPVLKERSLVKAFELFMRKDARLGYFMKELAERRHENETFAVEVGYFELDGAKPGDMPIYRWEHRITDKGGYTGVWTLVLHVDYVKRWEELRRNDVLVEKEIYDSLNFAQGKARRTASLAWANFYQVARRAMSDFDNGYTAKSRGQVSHITPQHAWSSAFIIDKEDREPERVGGRYAATNDAMWLLFLASQAYRLSRPMDNDLLKERMAWFLGIYKDKSGDLKREAELNALSLKLGLPKEFPSLITIDDKNEALALALAVNARYQTGFRAAPDAGDYEAMRAKLKAEYEARAKAGTVREALPPLGVTEEGVTARIRRMAEKSGEVMPAQRLKQDETSAESGTEGPPAPLAAERLESLKDAFRRQYIYSSIMAFSGTIFRREVLPSGYTIVRLLNKTAAAGTVIDPSVFVVDLSGLCVGIIPCDHNDIIKHSGSGRYIAFLSRAYDQKVNAQEFYPVSVRVFDVRSPGAPVIEEPCRDKKAFSADLSAEFARFSADDASVTFSGIVRAGLESSFSLPSGMPIARLVSEPGPSGEAKSDETSVESGSGEAAIARRELYAIAEDLEAQYRQLRDDYLLIGKENYPGVFTKRFGDARDPKNVKAGAMWSSIEKARSLMKRIKDLATRRPGLPRREALRELENMVTGVIAREGYAVVNMMGRLGTGKTTIANAVAMGIDDVKPSQIMTIHSDAFLNEIAPINRLIANREILHKGLGELTDVEFDLLKGVAEEIGMPWPEEKKGAHTFLNYYNRCVTWSDKVGSTEISRIKALSKTGIAKRALAELSSDERQRVMALAAAYGVSRSAITDRRNLGRTFWSIFREEESRKVMASIEGEAPATEPVKLFVVEGVYSYKGDRLFEQGQEELKSHIKVFVEVTEETRRQRIKTRGRAVMQEELIEMDLQDVLYAATVDTERDKADIILDNNRQTNEYQIWTSPSGIKAQFGIVTETAKDLMGYEMMGGGTVPDIFILPSNLFRGGRNYADVEFVLYYNLFLRQGRRMTLVGSAEQIENLRTILQYSLFGPDKDSAAFRGYDDATRKILQASSELYWQKPLKIDDAIEFVPFEAGRAVVKRLAAEIEIRHLNLNEYTIEEKGRSPAAETIEVDYRAPVTGLPSVSERRRRDIAEAIQKRFAVTTLGTSFGFDVKRDYTSFIIWIEGRGILVDPSPQALDYINALGLDEDTIPYVLLTHTHADHDGGVLRKILAQGRVKLIASRPVYDSFIAKSRALLGSQYDVSKWFDWMELKARTEGNDNVLAIPLPGGESARITARYNLHPIPTNGFRITYRGKTFGYAGDTEYDVAKIDALRSAGKITDVQAEDLKHFFWNDEGEPTADLVFHEVGGLIHTSIKQMAAQSQAVRDRLYIVHAGDTAVAKEPGVQKAKPFRNYTLIDTDAEAKDRVVTDIIASAGAVLGFDESQRAQVKSESASEMMLAGSKVLEQGEPITPRSKIYFIVSGSFGVSRKGSALPDVVLRPGDFFGEVGLEKGVPRTATVFALSNSEARVLDRAQYERIIKSPRSAAAVDAMGENLAMLQSWVSGIAGPEAITGATTNELRIVATRLQRRSFAAGSEMVRQGAKADGLYFVKEGQAEVLLEEGGVKRPIRRISSGGSFGEMALLPEYGVRTATVKAVTDVTAAMLTRGDFEELVKAFPGLNFALRRKVNAGVADGTIELGAQAAARAPSGELDAVIMHELVKAEPDILNAALLVLKHPQFKQMTPTVVHDKATGISNINIRVENPDNPTGRYISIDLGFRAEKGGVYTFSTLATTENLSGGNNVEFSDTARFYEAVIGYVNDVTSKAFWPKWVEAAARRKAMAGPASAVFANERAGEVAAAGTMISILGLLAAFAGNANIGYAVVCAGALMAIHGFIGSGLPPTMNGLRALFADRTVIASYFSFTKLLKDILVAAGRLNLNKIVALLTHEPFHILSRKDDIAYFGQSALLTFIGYRIARSYGADSLFLAFGAAAGVLVAERLIRFIIDNRPIRHRADSLVERDVAIDRLLRSARGYPKLLDGMLAIASAGDKYGLLAVVNRIEINPNHAEFVEFVRREMDRATGDRVRRELLTAVLEAFAEKEPTEGVVVKRPAAPASPVASGVFTGDESEEIPSWSARFKAWIRGVDVSETAPGTWPEQIDRGLAWKAVVSSDLLRTALRSKGFISERDFMDGCREVADELGFTGMPTRRATETALAGLMRAGYVDADRRTFKTVFLLTCRGADELNEIEAASGRAAQAMRAEHEGRRIGLSELADRTKLLKAGRHPMLQAARIRMLLERPGVSADDAEAAREALAAMEAGRGSVLPKAILTGDRTSPYFVGMSMGATKLYMALYGRDGTGALVKIDSFSIDWMSAFSLTDYRDIADPVKVLPDAMVEKIAEGLGFMLENHALTPQQLNNIGCTSPGPIDPRSGIIGAGMKTVNLPFDNYPFAEKLAARLNMSYTEVSHDAYSGLMGEVALGALSGFKRGAYFIQGSGFGGSVLADGRYFDDVRELTEPGHHLVGRPVEGRSYRYEYRWIMKYGDKHPLEVVRNPDPAKAHQISESDALKLIKMGVHSEDEMIWVVRGERDIEDIVAKQGIMPMLGDKARLATIFGGTPADYAKFNEPKDIDLLADSGTGAEKALAGMMVRYVGEELGKALAAFIEMSYGKPWQPERIVIGSGIGENLGRGLEINGEDFYFHYIRHAARAVLYGRARQVGISISYIDQIVPNIVRSPLSQEVRESAGFDRREPAAERPPKADSADAEGTRPGRRDPYAPTAEEDAIFASVLRSWDDIALFEAADELIWHGRHHLTPSQEDALIHEFGLGGDSRTQVLEKIRSGLEIFRPQIETRLKELRQAAAQAAAQAAKEAREDREYAERRTDRENRDLVESFGLDDMPMLELALRLADTGAEHILRSERGDIMRAFMTDDLAALEASLRRIRIDISDRMSEIRKEEREGRDYRIRRENRECLSSVESITDAALARAVVTLMEEGVRSSKLSADVLAVLRTTFGTNDLEAVRAVLQRIDLDVRDHAQRTAEDARLQQSKWRRAPGTPLSTVGGVGVLFGASLFVLGLVADYAIADEAGVAALFAPFVILAHIVGSTINPVVMKSVSSTAELISVEVARYSGWHSWKADLARSLRERDLNKVFALLTHEPFHAGTKKEPIAYAGQYAIIAGALAAATSIFGLAAVTGVVIFGVALVVSAYYPRDAVYAGEASEKAYRSLSTLSERELGLLVESYEAPQIFRRLQNAVRSADAVSGKSMGLYREYITALYKLGVIISEATGHEQVRLSDGRPAIGAIGGITTLRLALNEKREAQKAAYGTAGIRAPKADEPSAEGPTSVEGADENGAVQEDGEGEEHVSPQPDPSARGGITKEDINMAGFRLTIFGDNTACLYGPDGRVIDDFIDVTRGYKLTDTHLLNCDFKDRVTLRELTTDELVVTRAEAMRGWWLEGKELAITRNDGLRKVYDIETGQVSRSSNTLPTVADQLKVILRAQGKTGPGEGGAARGDFADIAVNRSDGAEMTFLDLFVSLGTLNREIESRARAGEEGYRFYYTETEISAFRAIAALALARLDAFKDGAWKTGIDLDRETQAIRLDGRKISDVFYGLDSTEPEISEDLVRLHEYTVDKFLELAGRNGWIHVTKPPQDALTFYRRLRAALGYIAELRDRDYREGIGAVMRAINVIVRGDDGIRYQEIHLPEDIEKGAGRDFPVFGHRSPKSITVFVRKSVSQEEAAQYRIGLALRILEEALAMSCPHRLTADLMAGCRSLISMDGGTMVSEAPVDLNRDEESRRLRDTMYPTLKAIGAFFIKHGEGRYDFSGLSKLEGRGAADAPAKADEASAESLTAEAATKAAAPLRKVVLVESKAGSKYPLCSLQFEASEKFTGNITPFSRYEFDESFGRRVRVAVGVSGDGFVPLVSLGGSYHAAVDMLPGEAYLIGRIVAEHRLFGIGSGAWMKLYEQEKARDAGIRRIMKVESIIERGKAVDLSIMGRVFRLDLAEAEAGARAFHDKQWAIEESIRKRHSVWVPTEGMGRMGVPYEKQAQVRAEVEQALGKRFYEMTLKDLGIELAGDDAFKAEFTPPARKEIAKFAGGKAWAGRHEISRFRWEVNAEAAINSGDTSDNYMYVAMPSSLQLARYGSASEERDTYIFLAADRQGRLAPVVAVATWTKDGPEDVMVTTPKRMGKEALEMLLRALPEKSCIERELWTAYGIQQGWVSAPEREWVVGSLGHSVIGSSGQLDVKAPKVEKPAVKSAVGRLADVLRDTGDARTDTREEWRPSYHDFLKGSWSALAAYKADADQKAVIKAGDVFRMAEGFDGGEIIGICTGTGPNDSVRYVGIWHAPVSGEKAEGIGAISFSESTRASFAAGNPVRLIVDDVSRIEDVLKRLEGSRIVVAMERARMAKRFGIPENLLSAYSEAKVRALGHVVGVPKEIKPYAERVGLTPEGVRFLTLHGIPVLVEKGAGREHFLDEEYAAAGAEIVETADEVWSRATIIKKVKEPLGRELELMREGQIIFTYFHLSSTEKEAKKLTLALLARKITAIAYETVTRMAGGRLATPLLKPMSVIAGDLGAYFAMAYLLEGKVDGDKVSLTPEGAGFIREVKEAYPSTSKYEGKLDGKEAVVLGGGVSGERMALKLLDSGARVTVTEINENRRSELKAIFERFGGRFTVLDPGSDINNPPAELSAKYESADILGGCILAGPGQTAPKMLRPLIQKISEKKKKVIVDIALDQGGNFEGSYSRTHADPCFILDGNIRYSVPNMPDAAGKPASIELEKANIAHTFALAMGWKDTVALLPELEGGFNAIDGVLTYDKVSKAYPELPYVQLREVIRDMRISEKIAAITDDDAMFVLQKLSGAGDEAAVSKMSGREAQAVERLKKAFGVDDAELLRIAKKNRELIGRRAAELAKLAKPAAPKSDELSAESGLTHGTEAAGAVTTEVLTEAQTRALNNLRALAQSRLQYMEDKVSAGRPVTEDVIARLREDLSLGYFPGKERYVRGLMARARVEGDEAVPDSPAVASRRQREMVNPSQGARDGQTSQREVQTNPSQGARDGQTSQREVQTNPSQGARDGRTLQGSAQAKTDETSAEEIVGVSPRGTSPSIVRYLFAGLTTLFILAASSLAEFLGVPDRPTVVATQAGDNRIFVRERNEDGTLGLPYAIAFKGVVWEPASIGTEPGDTNAVKADYIRWSTNDAALMAKMGVNAVRMFYSDVATNAYVGAIMDEFWRNGIKVILPPYPYFDMNRTSSIPALVNSMKDHPAVLMWVLGDGWDARYYSMTYSNLDDAVTFTEQAAQLIKSIDTNHPVATSFGEPHRPLNPYYSYPYHYLDRDTAPWAAGPFTSDIVSNLPSVDVWGLYVHRNDSLQSLLSEWAGISPKPMMLIDVGIDSYDHRIPGENQAMQRDADNGLWNETFYSLAPERTNGITSGIFYYQWNDVWGSEDTNALSHDAYTNSMSSANPDGWADNEWNGIVDIDRVPKLAYYGLQQRFLLDGHIYVPVATNPVLKVVSSRWSVGFEIDGRKVYYRNGDIWGGRGFNVAVLDEINGIRMKDFRHFDTAFDGTKHTDLQLYLNGLPDGSIAVVAICGDGGMGWPQAQATKQALTNTAWGSTMVGNVVSSNDTWALIAKKGTGKLAESKNTYFDAIAQAQPDLTATIDPAAGRRQAVVPAESSVIEGLRLTNGNFKVSFRSQDAFVYMVEYCDDLKTGEWKLARRGIVADGAATTWTDNGIFTGGTDAVKRFYRVTAVDRVSRVTIDTNGMFKTDAKPATVRNMAWLAVSAIAAALPMIAIAPRGVAALSLALAAVVLTTHAICGYVANDAEEKNIFANDASIAAYRDFRTWVKDVVRSVVYLRVNTLFALLTHEIFHSLPFEALSKFISGKALRGAIKPEVVTLAAQYLLTSYLCVKALDAFGPGNFTIIALAVVLPFLLDGVVMSVFVVPVVGNAWSVYGDFDRYVYGDVGPIVAKTEADARSRAAVERAIAAIESAESMSAVNGILARNGALLRAAAQEDASLSGRIMEAQRTAGVRLGFAGVAAEDAKPAGSVRPPLERTAQREPPKLLSRSIVKWLGHGPERIIRSPASAASVDASQGHRYAATSESGSTTWSHVSGKGEAAPAAKRRPVKVDAPNADSESKVDRPGAASAGISAASGATADADVRPLIEVVSEYFAPVARNEGPGRTEPTPSEIAQFYPAFEMIKAVTVEVYIPQALRTSITDAVEEEINALNKRITARTGRRDDAIVIKPYTPANLEAALLRRQPNVRKIFVNDLTMSMAFRELAEPDRGKTYLMRDNRLMTMNVPDGKNDSERSVRQAWLLKVAILSALVDDGNMLTVGSALKAELAGRLDANVSLNEFVSNLVSRDGENGADIARRISYFLDTIVRLSDFVGEQIRILKAFWTAA